MVTSILKIKPHFLISICFVLFVFSCVKEQNLPNHEKYIAHLKLDTTFIKITEVATDIDVPWDIEPGFDNNLWFTELKGTVNLLNLNTGEKKTVLQVPDVFYKKSHGLLGLAMHPNFKENPFLYLHYTFKIAKEGRQEETKSRIVRYSFENDTLVSPKILLDSIVGKTYHNGSRLVISPDLKLYFSMGDAGEPDLAQNINHLNGKIIRLNLDGSIPEDNPIKNNPVWSWGHRNPQGLVFSNKGLFYNSEHGPNNDDEINLISKGHNYGWPNIHGYPDLDNEKKYAQDSIITEPLKAWTPTLGTAGLAYYNDESIPEWKNALLSVNLKGRSLRVLKLSEDGKSITNETIYFQKRFGRIRDIFVDINGNIYLSTSNRDWHPRYQPWMYDSLPQGGDRIIKLSVDNNPKTEEIIILRQDTAAMKLFSEDWEFDVNDETVGDGERLYMEHCASCHRQNGEGVEGLNPPLANVDWVTGDKGILIRTVLFGLSDPIEINGKTYEQEMPGFSNLTDIELANILTYIRNNFGNQANPIIPGEVFEERK